MTLALASITALIVFLTVGFTVRRLISPAQASFVTPEWLAGFSIARYRPMERMLGDSDLEFARKTRGEEELRIFRQTRARLFRRYLSAVALDFNRLHRTARLLIVNAPTDQSQAAHQLMVQRFVFAAALLRLHFRVMLFEFGLASGQLAVSTLLDAIEGKRSQLSELLSVPLGAASRA